MSTLTKKVKYHVDERLDLNDKLAEGSLLDVSLGEYNISDMIDAVDGRVFYGFRSSNGTGPVPVGGFIIPAEPAFAMSRDGLMIARDGGSAINMPMIGNLIHYFHAYYDEADTDSDNRRFWISGAEATQNVATRLTRTCGIYQWSVGYGTGIPVISGFLPSALIGSVTRQLVPLYGVAVDSGNNITAVYDFRPMFAPAVGTAGGNRYTATVPDHPHDFTPALDPATIGIKNIREAFVALTDRIQNMKNTTNWYDSNFDTIKLQGTRRIENTDLISNVDIYGGTSANSGGAVRLFGPSHATTPNQINSYSSTFLFNNTSGTELARLSTNDFRLRGTAPYFHLLETDTSKEWFIGADNSYLYISKDASGVVANRVVTINDSGLGIYTSPGTSPLRVADASMTERMTLAAPNTTDSGTILSLTPRGTGEISIRLRHDGTSNYWEWATDFTNGRLELNYFTSHPMYVYNNDDTYGFRTLINDKIGCGLDASAGSEWTEAQRVIIRTDVNSAVPVVRLKRGTATQAVDFCMTSSSNYIRTFGKPFYIGTSDVADLLFRTNETDRLLIASDGKAYLNTVTASTDINAGGIVHMGGTVAAGKYPGLAHGITGVETDTFCTLKGVSSAGGLFIAGYLSGTSIPAVFIQGDMSGNAMSTSGTAYGVLHFVATHLNKTALAANNNLATFRSDTSTNNQVVFKGNGRIFVRTNGAGDGNVSLLDDEDDAVACHDIPYVLTNKTDKIIRYSKERLEKLGLIESGMLNIRDSNMLLFGAIGELYHVFNLFLKRFGLTYDELKTLARA